MVSSTNLEKSDGLVVGKFFPPHYGHFSLMSYALAHHVPAIDRLYVCVGSADNADQRYAEFTYRLRNNAIRAYFAHRGGWLNDRVKILPLCDIFAPTPELWGQYVYQTVMCAHPDANLEYHFTGSINDAHWFKGPWKHVIVDREEHFRGVSGTKIRELMERKEDISSLVPEEVLTRLNYEPRS